MSMGTSVSKADSRTATICSANDEIRSKTRLRVLLVSRWLHSTRCAEYPPTYYGLLRRKYFIEKIGQAKNPANYLQLKPPDFSFPPPSGSGSEAAVERLPPSLSVGPLPILAASRHWSLYTPTDGDGDEDERGLLLAKTRIHAESKKKKPE
jgi:hypothetical protein